MEALSLVTTRSPNRVLVTRSARQASELAESLRSLGADPIPVPALEIVEPTSFAVLDVALQQMNSYHWLLFTSANAVEVFARRLPTGVGASIPPPIAAIGEATALALRASGFAPQLMPPRAVAESFAEALLRLSRQPNGASTRFLLIRAEEAREHLPEVLREAGAEVTVAPAYRTTIPAGSVRLLQQLLSDPIAYPDAITFTSSSAVRNLLALCEAADRELPASALRISIGPVTSDALRQAGLPPHAEAEEATVAALAGTVMKALRDRIPKERERQAFWR